MKTPGCPRNSGNVEFHRVRPPCPLLSRAGRKGLDVPAGHWTLGWRWWWRWRWFHTAELLHQPEELPGMISRGLRLQLKNWVLWGLFLVLSSWRVALTAGTAGTVTGTAGTAGTVTGTVTGTITGTITGTVTGTVPLHCSTTVYKYFTLSFSSTNSRYYLINSLIISEVLHSLAPNTWCRAAPPSGCLKTFLSVFWFPTLEKEKKQQSTCTAAQNSVLRSFSCRSQVRLSVLDAVVLFLQPDLSCSGLISSTTVTRLRNPTCSSGFHGGTCGGTFNKLSSESEFSTKVCLDQSETQMFLCSSWTTDSCPNIWTFWSEKPNPNPLVQTRPAWHRTSDRSRPAPCHSTADSDWTSQSEGGAYRETGIKVQWAWLTCGGAGGGVGRVSVQGVGVSWRWWRKEAGTGTEGWTEDWCPLLAESRPWTVGHWGRRTEEDLVLDSVCDSKLSFKTSVFTPGWSCRCGGWGRRSLPQTASLGVHRIPHLLVKRQKSWRFQKAVWRFKLTVSQWLF